PADDRGCDLARAAAERPLQGGGARRATDARPAWPGAEGRRLVPRGSPFGRHARVPRLALRLGPNPRRAFRAARGFRPRRVLARVVAHLRGVAAARRGEATGERARIASPAPGFAGR